MPISLQSALVACLATVVALRLFSRLAYRIDLLDRPSERKRHDGAIPLVGGLAVFSGFFITLLVVWWSVLPLPHISEGKSLVLLVPVLASILVVGAIDDHSHLSAKLRLMFELAIGLLVAEWLAIRIVDLGDLLGMGSISLGRVTSTVFTIVALFGVINAINMLDGIDGLVGTLVITVIAAFHMYLSIPAGIISITLAAAIGAFLLSNFGVFKWLPKTFLGDAGSRFLGAVVFLYCVLAALPTFKNVQPLPAAACLYLVAIPLFDMTVTTLRRALKGHNPLSPDRTHLHHLCLALGLSTRKTLFVIVALTLMVQLIGCALLRDEASDARLFGTFMVLFVFYVLGNMWLWSIAHRRQAHAPSTVSH
jgi:UDP-GlcNAc:undecaprenyl-phosphate GlcNAc-1-phosphate transferase